MEIFVVLNFCVTEIVILFHIIGGVKFLQYILSCDNCASRFVTRSLCI